jgi:hypothetical protein
MQPRRAVFLLVAVLLCGLIYLLEPWSDDGSDALHDAPAAAADPGAPTAIDPSSLLGKSREAGAQLEANGTAAEVRPGAGSAAQRSEIEGTWIHGRLRFPNGVAVPEGSRVCAVESSRARSGAGARERLVNLVSRGEQGFAQVLEDGRFRIALPGPEPFARKWVIYAGAIGWAGSVVFPDPRPLAPGPEEEFEVWMQPVFGASIELVTPTGARPHLHRDLLRESGGHGLYVNGRWSVHGPLATDSHAALLSVPNGLPPLVGGQDPSIGLAGPELAIQIGASENWTSGEFQHWFNLEFPGYEPIKEVLRFGPLAKGDIPHYKFVLRPLRAIGELRLQFDRAEWWRRELDPHNAGRLKLRAHRLDSPEGFEQRDYEMSLQSVPASGELMLEDIPSGLYRLELVATNSGVPLPLSPAEVRIPAAGRAESRVDCGGLGAIELSVADGSAAEWSTGRLEILALDQDQMRRFRSEQWPVFLGPLPVTESGVILVRSLDRKTPPQVADRLNHSDEFTIVDGVTTRYSISGVL